ncbi:alpha/beta hydrolase domain-containing protein [Streptomyces sp. NPDC096057]|uniref:alpha/beta hydrolase domain-containing protein n=1 Tax=Streptomyces sp. NPDC096057 TaxID=3155543 RepID=UPI00332C8062
MPVGPHRAGLTHTPYPPCCPWTRTHRGRRRSAAPGHARAPTSPHREIIRQGHLWVGVSARRVGVEGGLLPESTHLKVTDPERYTPDPIPVTAPNMGDTDKPRQGHHRTFRHG